jgi:hypothetical protein
LILIGIAAKDSPWKHAKKGFFSQNPGEYVEEWVQKKEVRDLLSFVLAAGDQNRHQKSIGVRLPPSP